MNIWSFLNENKLSIIGGLAGAIAGFLYWKFIGCPSGRCLITSRPINATLYGALLGYLIFNIFKK